MVVKRIWKTGSTFKFCVEKILVNLVYEILYTIVDVPELVVLGVKLGEGLVVEELLPRPRGLGSG